jgi:hypothetical protein
MSGQRAGSVYVPLGGRMRNGQITGRTAPKTSSVPKFIESLSKVKRAKNIGTREEPQQEPSPELSLGQLFEDARQANLRDQGAQEFSAPQAPAPQPMPGQGIMMGPGRSARMGPGFSQGFDPRQLEMMFRNRRRGMR